MPTTLPHTEPTTVAVPAGVTYDVSRDHDGAPVLTLYTQADEPAVRLRVDDADAAAALLQGARVLATTMGVMP